MRLGKIIKGVSVDREGKKSKVWVLEFFNVIGWRRGEVSKGEWEGEISEGERILGESDF